MFLNFKNVLETSRKRPPFGIAQIGKSFRNEITPGNFVFRTREFEQMEMEYFVPPDESRAVVRVLVPASGCDWYLDLGMPADKLRLRRPRRRRAVALLVGHERRRVPVPVGLGRARGHRQPRRLRPHPARRRTRARSSSTSTRRPTSATCPTSSSRPRAPPARRWRSSWRPTTRRRWPARARAGRDPHRAAPPPPPRALQGGGAAAVEEGRAAGPGQRGAGAAPAALHVRLRRDPGHRPPLPAPGRARHAVLRHRRLRHLDDQAVTVRDRDSMAQDRVPIADLLDHLRPRLEV